MARKFRSDDTDKWLEGFGNGLDGDLVISSNTTEAPIDASCSGTAGAFTLAATNASFAPGQIVLIHKSRGNTTVAAGEYEFNKITAYVAGTLTLKYALQNSYNDSGADQSQVRVLKQYNNVTVNNGITWTAKAWNGDVGGILAFLAKGTVSGVTNGIISLNGKGYDTADNNITGYDGPGIQGEGTAGASTSRTNAKNGNGGGGGGGANSTNHAGGGGGSNGGAGVNGTNSGTGVGGTTGDIVGTASLTTALFGGSGGGGATYGTEYGGSGGQGGSGGGFALIIANDIDLSGLTISLNGDNGTTGAGNVGGGGGGAGGSALLKVKTATLGTNKIVSNYGNGGGVSGTAGVGGRGGVGRIHIDYKDSYTGTTNPTIDASQDLTLDYSATGIGYMLQKFIEEDEALYN